MRQQLVLQILRQIAEPGVEGIMKQNGQSRERLMASNPYVFKTMIVQVLTEIQVLWDDAALIRVWQPVPDVSGFERKNAGMSSSSMGLALGAYVAVDVFT